MYLFSVPNKLEPNSSREDHLTPISDSGVELRDVVKTESNAAQVILANGDKFVVDFVVLAIGVQAQECWKI